MSGIWMMAAFLLVAIFASFTTFTIWSRRETSVRALAVAMFLATVPVSFAAVGSALSWPVPFVPVLTAPGGEYKVMSVKMVQDEGIYFLLDFSEHSPRYYWTPWDSKLANKLQDMMDDPKNGGVKLKVPFDWSWDNHKPQFHPIPQPKLIVPKPRQPEPRRFNT